MGMITSWRTLPVLPPIPLISSSDPALQPLCDAISAFCDDIGGRFSLGTPWVKDGFLYATDGRQIIRMHVGNRQGETFTIQPPHGDGEVKRPRTAKLFQEEILESAWSRCDVELPVDRPCDKCDGNGTKKCGHCQHVAKCGECANGVIEAGDVVVVLGLRIQKESFAKLLALRQVGELQIARKKTGDSISFRVLRASGEKVVDGLMMANY